MGRGSKHEHGQDIDTTAREHYLFCYRKLYVYIDPNLISETSCVYPGRVAVVARLVLAAQITEICLAR